MFIYHQPNQEHLRSSDNQGGCEAGQGCSQGRRQSDGRRHHGDEDHVQPQDASQPGEPAGGLHQRALLQQDLATARVLSLRYPAIDQ